MKTISILLLTILAAFADGPRGPIIKSPGQEEYHGKVIKFDEGTRILQVSGAQRGSGLGDGTKAGFRVPGVVSITVPTEDALLRKGTRAGSTADLKPGARVTVTHIGSERLVTKIMVESAGK